MTDEDLKRTLQHVESETVGSSQNITAWVQSKMPDPVWKTGSKYFRYHQHAGYAYLGIGIGYLLAEAIVAKKKVVETEPEVPQLFKEFIDKLDLSNLDS